MKKILILVLLLSLAQATFSQNTFSKKGDTQFSVLGGYAHFPELWARNGYNLGGEIKHYVKDRIFLVAGFHAGINNGSYLSVFSGYNNREYSVNLNNSVRDYMLGIGLGGDVLSIGRHRIYVQGTVGLGNSNRQKDRVKTDLVNGEQVNTVQTKVYDYTRWALTLAAGYAYRATDWLAVGINYTGFQVGRNFNNGYNLKLTWLF